MARRETPRQRQWVKAFLASHPKHELVKRSPHIDGSWVYIIRWDEDLENYILSGEPDLDPGSGYQTKEMQVILNRTATKVTKKEVVTKIVWLCCSLTYRHKSKIGQTTLPLSQLLEIKATNNKKHSRTFSKPHEFLQHELPLDQTTSLMMEIRLREGSAIKSKQDLLSESTEYYSQSQKRNLKMPQALADLLTELNATPEEWESAEELLGVIGECGALKYIQAIPEWRALK